MNVIAPAWLCCALPSPLVSRLVPLLLACSRVQLQFLRPVSDDAKLTPQVHLGGNNQDRTMSVSSELTMSRKPPASMY